jgi:hypothetical protein
MLIDCEVGHYGDPAFDLGFFLTHLIAKGVHRRAYGENRPLVTLDLCNAFLEAYAHGLQSAVSGEEQGALQRRAVLNLAGCLLARVDGKSPLEYLSLESQRDALRRMGRQLFDARPKTLEKALVMVETELSDLS